MLGYPLGWMIAAGLFFLLIVACALSPVKIRGYIKREGDNDRAELRVRALFGLVHYYWKLPDIRMNGMDVKLKAETMKENMGGTNHSSSMKHIDVDSVMSGFHRVHAIMMKTDHLLGWARLTLRHVRLTEWQWKTAVGLGDAMWTAMATGMIWSAKTTSIGLISQLVRLASSPELAVIPVYNGVYFATEGRFAARISIGYAMFAGLRLLIRIRKMKETPRGLRAWQRILHRA